MQLGDAFSWRNTGTHVAVGTRERVVDSASAPGAGAGAPGTTDTAEAGGVVGVIAHAVCDSLALTSRQEGRVLIVEPHAPSIGVELRAAGFAGEYWALVTRPMQARLRAEGGYDHLLVAGWTDRFARGAAAPGDPAAPSDLRFDAIIAHDLLRIVPPAQFAAALAWLGTLLEPLGFLVSSESAAHLQRGALDKDLRAASLLPTRDDLRVEDSWQWNVAVYQVRSHDEAQRIGALSRVSSQTIHRSDAFQGELVHAYQEAFAGDQWQEWMRCTRCGRQYSRSQYEALRPAMLCACGGHASFVPFHTPESIIGKLRSEVSDDDRGCCYVRMDDEGAIEGFSWGYVCGVDECVRAIVPAGQDRAAETLRSNLSELLASVGGEGAPFPVYYHSELGVAEAARRFSLARALFQRPMHFADARGAKVTVLWTSPRADLYRLVLSLGMRVLCWYYGDEEPAREGTSMPESGRLVALGADVRSIIRLFECNSDRRLIARMAHVLRDQAGEEAG